MAISHGNLYSTQIPTPYPIYEACLGFWGIPPSLFVRFKMTKVRSVLIQVKNRLGSWSRTSMIFTCKACRSFSCAATKS